MAEPDALEAAELEAVMRQLDVNSQDEARDATLELANSAANRPETEPEDEEEELCTPDAMSPPVQDTVTEPDAEDAEPEAELEAAMSRGAIATLESANDDWQKAAVRPDAMSPPVEDTVTEPDAEDAEPEAELEDSEAELVAEDAAPVRVVGQEDALSPLAIAEPGEAEDASLEAELLLSSSTAIGVASDISAKNGEDDKKKRKASDK